VKKVMNDLIEFGIVQRGYLGVKISDVTQELQEKNKLKDLKGVYVAEVVDGGSADKGGLKNGDVILKIGNTEVNSVANLQEEIGKKRPGDKIDVLIRQKDGDEVIKSLVLRNKEGETNLISKEEIKKNAALGATFIELTDKEKKELNISYGVKITSVTTGKLKSLGLGIGTIITKVNNEAVETVDQLTSKLNGNNRGILLEIINTSGRKDYVGFGL
jgi:serine protease Do